MNRIARKFRAWEVRAWRVFFRLRGRRKKYQSLLKDRIGLEIGGPSGQFAAGSLMQIYPAVRQLDGCDFASNTLWTKKEGDSQLYHYEENRSGRLFICDAVNLAPVKPADYDFVISSNCLEHIANPMKAIREWLRVTKDNGVLVIMVPRKQSNFDHSRPVTSFAHILSDFEKDMGEDDLTHLDEILRLHDLPMDADAGNFEQFKSRSLRNFENRALHHHVFDLQLLKQIAGHFGLKIILKDNVGSDYVIAMSLQRVMGSGLTN